jgi:hypothetical protein
MLYVTKADAYNSNVTLNVIDNSSSAFNEESEEFERGPVVTNQSQVNGKIRDIVGNEDTKQLFTLIKATVDVNGSGLTLPVPKMTKGKYKFN